MNDSDKVKMTIKIGAERFTLSKAYNEQDAVRDAEKLAASLFDTWRVRWPSHSDTEIMARVAYQFAYLYQTLLGEFDEAARIAATADDRLSEIINTESSI